MIPPNTSCTIAGYIHNGVDHAPTSAVLHETEDSLLTEHVDVAPSLIHYQGTGKGLVDVVVSNISTRTVCVPPRGMLCEIQPVQCINTFAGDIPLRNPPQKVSWTR